MGGVDPGEEVELQPLDGRLGGERFEIWERLGAGQDVRSLMAAGEEVAPPGLGTGIRGRRGDDDKRRQIFILCAEAVAHPGAVARAGELGGACVGGEGSLVVAVAVAVHRVQNAEIVDDAADGGKQIAHPGAAAAVWLEPPPRLDEEALEGPRLVEPARGGDRLAMVGEELRLEVEGVDVRHAAGRVEENHPVGGGGEVRRMWCEWIERCGGR